MALRIVLTNENGIKTDYHRIKTVILNDNNSKVIISNYVSGEYRELEKTVNQNRFKRDNLIDQIAVEMSNDVPDTALITELTNRANALTEICKEVNCEISNEEIEISFDKTSEVSFSSLYTQLKTLEKFNNATDI
jgi:hypothetical protein